MSSKLTIIMTCSAALALSACMKPIDVDLRSLGRGFDTSDAVQNLPARRAPDSRGIITYPNYQVVVARRGDTVSSVASRIGISAGELARHNALNADTPLRDGEVLALPRKVGASSTSGVSSTPLPPAKLPTGSEPLRHTVRSGETAYSIARLYDVPVQSIAKYNGLAGDLAVRQGQILIVPVAGRSGQSTPVTQPGSGSPTPTPPSAATPLPKPTSAPTPAAQAKPRPAPTTTAASAPKSSRLLSPVTGSVIREYSKGRNEGIDIAVPAGTAVKAADAGTVAAVTEDTKGAKIVVLKHSGGLLTVYVNLKDLKVSKGASVSRGQAIAAVADGSPSSLHFEVRKGLESVDPADYLP